MLGRDEFEHKIQRATQDIARSCRALVSRCQAIVELAEYEDAMCPQARSMRSVKRDLEAALSSLATLAGERLQVERISNVTPGGRAERVVVKCVTSLMSGLDEDVREGEGKDSKRSTKTMHGHSAVVGIPELLDFLCNLGKTGVLEVQTLSETFTLVVQHGDVVYAMSNNSPAGLRLGDILVEQGAISLGRLETELAKIDTTKKPLGEAMEESKFITAEKLEEALEYQCRQLFQRLFTAEEATFSFRETGVPELGHIARLNVRTLLLESMMRRDGTGYMSNQRQASQRAARAAPEPTPVAEPAESGTPPAPPLTSVDPPFGGTPPDADGYGAAADLIDAATRKLDRDATDEPTEEPTEDAGAEA